MDNVKAEPRSPLTDINNNLNSPENFRDSSPKVSVSLTPKSSKVSVSLTPKSSKVSVSLSPNTSKVSVSLTPKTSPCISPKTSSKDSEPRSDCEDKDELDTDDDEQVLPKGKRPPGAVRRRNERERNRVKHINRTFSVLRQHLPTRKANKKLSKVETLRSAVDYIKHLRQILADHDSLTAAISLEQALLAHNQQLQHQHHNHLRQQQYRLQGQYARSLPFSLQYSQSRMAPNLDSSLCSPTGSLQSPSYSCTPSPMVSPTSYQQPQQQDGWEQATTPADAELLELAAEAGIADIDLW